MYSPNNRFSDNIIDAIKSSGNYWAIDKLTKHDVDAALFSSTSVIANISCLKNSPLIFKLAAFCHSHEDLYGGRQDYAKPFLSYLEHNPNSVTEDKDNAGHTVAWFIAGKCNCHGFKLSTSGTKQATAALRVKDYTTPCTTDNKKDHLCEQHIADDSGLYVLRYEQNHKYDQAATREQAQQLHTEHVSKSKNRNLLHLF